MCAFPGLIRKSRCVHEPGKNAAIDSMNAALLLWEDRACFEASAPFMADLKATFAIFSGRRPADNRAVALDIGMPKLCGGSLTPGECPHRQFR